MLDHLYVGVGPPIMYVLVRQFFHSLALPLARSLALLPAEGVMLGVSGLVYNMVSKVSNYRNIEIYRNIGLRYIVSNSINPLAFPRYVLAEILTRFCLSSTHTPSIEMVSIWISFYSSIFRYRILILVRYPTPDSSQGLRRPRQQRLQQSKAFLAGQSRPAFVIGLDLINGRLLL